VADEDQRRRCGRWRPQDAGHLAEHEFAFEDAVVQALFGREVHAFRASALIGDPGTSIRTYARHTEPLRRGRLTRTAKPTPARPAHGEVSGLSPEVTSRHEERHRETRRPPAVDQHADHRRYETELIVPGES
jgi:hypothetical protein